MKKMPKLDLHTETSRMVYPLLQEFINTNYLLGESYIKVVHGKSSNILKDEVEKTLRNDKRIKRYYRTAFNLGETIIELNI